jgi:hypothetical protein
MLQCARAVLRMREAALRAEAHRVRREIDHWNSHVPSNLRDPKLKLRSRLAGRDANGSECESSTR